MKKSIYKSCNDLPLMLNMKRSPRRNPAERFHWREEEQRNE